MTLLREAATAPIPAHAMNTDLSLHDFRNAEDDDLDALRDYINIKAEIARLNERLDELKPRILDLLFDQPSDAGDKAPTGHAFGCTFTVQYRTSYEYTDAVTQLAHELRALKKLEEARGLATVKKQQAILIMKAPKIRP